MDGLRVFCALVYIEDNNYTTKVCVFAKNKIDARRYVSDYLDTHVTYDWFLDGIYEVDPKEGKII